MKRTSTPSRSFGRRTGQRNRDKGEVSELYTSVSSISSKDALQMFHDDVMGGRRDNPHNHAVDNDDLTIIPDDISGCKQLGRFSKQLESLLCECPSIEVHMAAEMNKVV